MGTIPQNGEKVTTNPQAAVDSIRVRRKKALNPFAAVPHSVARDGTLSATAIRLYVVLVSHADWSDRECSLHVSTLAREMGCNVRTVFRAQKDLVDRKLLEIQSGQAAGVANVYVLDEPGGHDTDVAPPTTSTSDPLRHPCHTEQEPSNENQPTRVLSAPNGAKATDDPLKKCAHRLTVVAMERKTKPVIARSTNPFPAVMKLTESLLRAGWSDVQIERVYATADRVVWTTAGLQDALERNLRADRAKAGERARPRSEAELLMEAQEASRWEGDE